MTNIIGRIILCGIIIFLLSCPMHAARTDSDLYPRIDGWNRSDSIKIFTPDNLYNFIDGAADAYLMQDFERLTVAYYTHGDTSVTVEIYQHRTDENAYGMYVQERSSPIEVLPIGIEGYYAESVLNFVIGRTYVKLTSYTLGSREKEVLELISRNVAATIGGATTRPAYIECFPKYGLIPNSERFVGRDFLGYTFFRSGYIADYRIDTTSFQMFIIENAGSTSCNEVLKKYLSTVKRLRGRPPCNSVLDPYWGNVTIACEEGTIVGVIGIHPGDTAESMVAGLNSNILSLMPLR